MHRDAPGCTRMPGIPKTCPVGLGVRPREGLQWVSGDSTAADITMGAMLCIVPLQFQVKIYKMSHRKVRYVKIR